MSLYELFKTIHVLAAVIWVGGGILSQLQAVRARNAGPTQLATFAQEMAWFGPHFFAPVSMIVLLAGIAMVIVSGWNFSDLWIVLGLAGFAATFVTGMAFLGPQSKLVGEGLAQRGPDDPEVQKGLARLFAISRVDAIVLTLVVINMVVKPGV